jgi:hypothetical protein
MGAQVLISATWYKVPEMFLGLLRDKLTRQLLPGLPRRFSV